MKQKHNKKRNTAFLYEALARELTISILEQDEERRLSALSVLREFFKKDAVLAKELELYNNLSGVGEMAPHSADKLIQETRYLYSTINRKNVFNQQTKLINTINKKISKDVFSYFVPNYKDLATIYQIFNSPVGSKDRVILEESLIKQTKPAQDATPPLPAPDVDNLIYKTFVSKFNEQYSEELSSEQRTLLEKYVFSFADNGLEFKIFLNEEVSRLKSLLVEAKEGEELLSDEDMSRKAGDVLELLEGYRAERSLETKDLIKILKVQSLVKELDTSGD